MTTETANAYLDRFTLSRQIPYDHRNRLMCKRDESGKCFLCRRKIGFIEKPISGQVPVSPEDVEGPLGGIRP